MKKYSIYGTFEQYVIVCENVKITSNGDAVFVDKEGNCVLAIAPKGWLNIKCIEEVESNTSIKIPTFVEAWKQKELEGYQYGKDALEQVHFGWDMAMSYIKEMSSKVDSSSIADKD